MQLAPESNDIFSHVSSEAIVNKTLLFHLLMWIPKEFNEPPFAIQNVGFLAKNCCSFLL